MELIQQLEEWQRQIDTRPPHATHADLDVAQRLVKHGIAALGEIARTERNRDMWQGQVERQAAQIERMRAAMLEGARILEADGDEWGVAHLLREAMTPNDQVKGDGTRSGPVGP